MEYIKECLERQARRWQGISINDQLAGREPTPMITVEMPVSDWERLWASDPTPDLYEACREAFAWLNLDEHVTAKQLAQKLDRVIAQAEA